MDLEMFTLDRSSNKTFRFNEYVDIKKGGSITLGFLYITTVVKDLFGNGMDYVMSLPEIVVRLNRNADFRIEFPTTVRITWVTCGGCQVKVSDVEHFCSHCGAALNPTEAALKREKIYDPMYFSGNSDTRQALTKRIFEIPEVQTAMVHAIDKVEALAKAAKEAGAPAEPVAVATAPVLNAEAGSAIERLRARQRVAA